MTVEKTTRQRFLDGYRQIRHAEGRGSDTSDYYRALPFCDPADPNAAMWEMRAKTFSYFLKKILAPLEQRYARPLDVLDLGAGNCWLSHRLTLRGHRSIAVDIFPDERDGLRAAHHYRNASSDQDAFSVVESDFDCLPLPGNSMDLAIFNASFHYSIDYVQTLTEVQRCLRPSGLFVILDTPIYRLKEHGQRMVEEKHSRFLKQYGFPSDALPSIDFLDIATVHSLRQHLSIDWRIHKPWYGWQWRLRPLKAYLSGRRPPSSFWIHTGRFKSQ